MLTRTIRTILSILSHAKTAASGSSEYISSVSFAANNDNGLSMICHDRADKMEGRPKRNWGEERFLCTACLAKAQNKRPRRGRKPKEGIPGENAEQDIDGAAVEASQATLPPSSQDTAEGSPVQDAPMDISTSPQASRPAISFATGTAVNGFQNASTPVPNGVPPSHDNQSNAAPSQSAPTFHQVSMWTSNPVGQMSQPPPVNPYASFSPALNGFGSGSFGNVARQPIMPFNGFAAPAMPLANGLYQPSPPQPVSQSMPLAGNAWPQGQVPHVNGNSQPVPPIMQQQPTQQPFAYQPNEPSS